MLYGVERPRSRNEEGSYTLCAHACPPVEASATEGRLGEKVRRTEGGAVHIGPGPGSASEIPHTAICAVRGSLVPPGPRRTCKEQHRSPTPARAITRREGPHANTPIFRGAKSQKKQNAQGAGGVRGGVGGLPLPPPRSRRRVEFVGGVGKDGRTRVNGEGLGFLFSVRGAPKGRWGADQEGGRIRERSESEDHSADRDTLGGARTRHVSSPSSGLEPHGGAETRPFGLCFLCPPVAQHLRFGGSASGRVL